MNNIEEIVSKYIIEQNLGVNIGLRNRLKHFIKYALSNPSEFGLVSREWVSVKDRLPTSEDVFDDYDEVLTVQVGRKRPTMMKYWEIKNCPFTTFWMVVPPLPNKP